MAEHRDPPICYYRAAVKPSGPVLGFAATNESFWVAHFYVRTDETSTAGAVGAEFCADHKLEFVEFLCLPQVIARAQIAAHEPEHLAAFALAERDGVATVLSVVVSPVKA